MRKNILKIIGKTLGCAVIMAAVTLSGIQLPNVAGQKSSSIAVADAATVTDRLPIVAYTRYSGNLNTYTDVNLTNRTGYICSYDKCTILNIYGNGAVQVRYPVSRGTRVAYAAMSGFFIDENFSTSIGRFGEGKTAYRKSTGGETIGSVYGDDSVMIIGLADGRTQVLYPTSSGFKLGWVDGLYEIGHREEPPAQSEPAAPETPPEANTGIGSPVPSGCKFNRKTTDGSWYGYHDINRNVSTSTPVYAIADGTVTYKQAYRKYSGVKKLTSYGNYINFTSSDGVYTAKYCHLNSFVGATQIISSSRTVRRSGCTGTLTIATRTVKKGEIIGYIGTTGNSSGVHLHFELRKNNSRIDPTSEIPGLI